MSDIKLKPAENQCTVEGILSEVKLTKGVGKTNKKAYIMGEIKIKTNAMINNVSTELEVPVRVFANQLKNDNTPNPAYDSIAKIEEMTSLAACGGDVDKADRIRFENATIQMNEFYNRDEKLVSYPTVRGTFCRKIDTSKCMPAASFSNVIVVGGLREETDRNGDLTGRLIVKGILPQWGDRVDVVDYVVASEAAKKHIQEYWQKGDTVRVAGVLNFSSTVETEIVEMGFGEPEVKHRTRSVSELLITKGSQGALDAEFAYDPELISEALTKRQAYLNELKNNSNKKAEVAAKASTTDLGF